MDIACNMVCQEKTLENERAGVEGFTSEPFSFGLWAECLSAAGAHGVLS